VEQVYLPQIWLRRIFGNTRPVRIRSTVETFSRFDDLLGIERLLAFHLNDSMKPLGCRVDRHEQACKGEIGPLAFRRLVNDARFHDVPGYLEIPPEGNRATLQRLKRLREERPRHRPRSRVATPRRDR